MKNLPKGWVRVRLSEVAAADLGRMLDAAKQTGDRRPYLRNQNVRWDDFDLSEVFEMPFESHEIQRYSVAKGDLLICEGGEPGRAAVWDGRIPEVMYQKALHRVRPTAALCARFLLHRLRYDAGRSTLDEYFTGTTIKHLTGTSLSRYAFELPPIGEQLRIVAKLDSVFAKSQSIRQRLERLPTMLDTLTGSVLAAAFRGDLTRDWREANPDIEPIADTASRVAHAASRTGGREATSSVIPGRFALAVGNPETLGPSGWEWMPLSAVARMESGHTPSRGEAAYWDGGIPWLGIGDARENHAKVITATRQTVSAEGLANSSSRLLPAGTVCLSRTASVGYVTLMGVEMATSQDFANWVCSSALNPEFLMWLLIAENESLLRFSKGSTHSTIYFPELKAFHVCLPPVAEQDVIVREIQRRLAAVEAIARRVDAMAIIPDDIESAALAKAFRGELVPQDPSDEPASVLLERVRAERAAAETTPKAKRGAGRRAKKAEVTT